MMKFEDAKVGMKVYINHPNVKYNEGIITAISEPDRAIFVEQPNHKQFNSIWFWEGTHTYSLSAITPIKNKVPKFDTDLVNSKEFHSYLNSVSNKYEKEFLPKGVYLTDVSIHENGRIVVKDNKGNKGISKCNQIDAFNLEVGLQLAIQRLAEKTPFVPKDGEFYYSILLSTGNAYKSTFYVHIFSDELNKAIGNCFRTKEEAEKNKEKITSRFTMLLKYAELIAKEDN
jgi:hypothetical protein